MMTLQNSLSKFILTVLLGISTLLVHAQNLVPNGGFEEGNSCPEFLGDLEDKCSNWYTSVIDSENIVLSPDWYHECSDIDILSPPDVALGNLNPFNGQGYAGLIIHKPNFGNVRENIAVQLTEPLDIGQSYLISFAIGKLNGLSARIASNNFGFNFSTHPFYSANAFPINQAHFNIDTIIELENEWVVVEQAFVADSSYSYLHFGNFFDDANTDYVIQGTPAVDAYYTIDQVSVSSFLSDEFRPKDKTIKIHPNPTSDYVTVVSQSLDVEVIFLYNASGQLLRVIRNPDKPFQFSMADYSPGIYLIVFQTPKTIFYEKIIKN